MKTSVPPYLLVAFIVLNMIAWCGLWVHSRASAHVPQVFPADTSSINITLVTALYNIHRVDRHFEQYIEWFQKTLQINLPMVIFCNGNQKQVPDLVWKVRRSTQGNITAVVLEDKYPLSDLSNDVLPLLLWDHTDDASAVEWSNPHYILLCFSKFKWIQMAIHNHYLPATQYYAWIDAGISRFFLYPLWIPIFPAAHTLRFPGLVQQRADTLAIETVFENEAESSNLLKNEDAIHIGYRKNWFKAGVFGGSKDVMLWTSEKMLDIFLKDMIAKRQMDNEQAAFALLYSRFPEKFTILYPSVHFNVSSYSDCHFVCL